MAQGYDWRLRNHFNNLTSRRVYPAGTSPAARQARSLKQSLVGRISNPSGQPGRIGNPSRLTGRIGNPSYRKEVPGRRLRDAQPAPVLLAPSPQFQRFWKMSKPLAGTRTWIRPPEVGT